MEDHTCLKTRSLKGYTSKFLASKIIQQVETNITVPVRGLLDELKQRLELGISKMKMIRAKQIAQTHLFGDYQNQYSLLREYVLELQTCNEGTIVKIEV